MRFFRLLLFGYKSQRYGSYVSHVGYILHIIQIRGYVCQQRVRDDSYIRDVGVVCYMRYVGDVGDIRCNCGTEVSIVICKMCVNPKGSNNVPVTEGHVLMIVPVSNVVLST